MTDQTRIILFCDVERPMKFKFMTRLNRWVSRHIIKASATDNAEGERVGWLNRLFSYLYEVHLAGRRIKDWNRNVYYGLKYLLLGAVAAALLIPAFA
jgi:beta-hydroxylase